MEKRKNKIKSAFALALSLGLLCQSFPALAEEKPWDVNDNIISFREIPDLVDQFSTVAKMEQDALAQSTGGMASVQKAVKDEKADILAKAAGVKVIGLKDAHYTFEREDYGESLGARCARETVRVKDDAPIFNPVEIKISCYVGTTWDIELLPPDDLL